MRRKRKQLNVNQNQKHRQNTANPVKIGSCDVFRNSMLNDAHVTKENRSCRRDMFVKLRASRSSRCKTSSGHSCHKPNTTTLLLRSSNSFRLHTVSISLVRLMVVAGSRRHRRPLLICVWIGVSTRLSDRSI